MNGKTACLPEKNISRCGIGRFKVAKRNKRMAEVKRSCLLVGTTFSLNPRALLVLQTLRLQSLNLPQKNQCLRSEIIIRPSDIARKISNSIRKYPRNSIGISKVRKAKASDSAYSSLFKRPLSFSRSGTHSRSFELLQECYLAFFAYALSPALSPFLLLWSACTAFAYTSALDIKRYLNIRIVCYLSIAINSCNLPLNLDKKEVRQFP